MDTNKSGILSMTKYGPNLGTDEYLRGIANELGRVTAYFELAFKLISEQERMSKAHNAEEEAYAAEMRKRENERNARYEARELEREATEKAEHELNKLKLHVGNKLEVLELGEPSEHVKVGDVLTVTKIEIGSWEDTITVTLGDYAVEYKEAIVKRMMGRGWIKLVA